MRGTGLWKRIVEVLRCTGKSRREVAAVSGRWWRSRREAAVDMADIDSPCLG